MHDTEFNLRARRKWVALYAATKKAAPSADAAVSPLQHFASGGVVSRQKAKLDYTAAVTARIIHPAAS